MYNLFEQSDSLNTPVECFICNSESNDFPIKPHWHYFAEFIFMLSGFAEMHSGENNFSVQAGEMVIFHSQTVHSIYAANGGKPNYAVLKFDLNRLDFTSAYAPKMRSIFKSAANKHMPILFSAETAESLGCRRLFLNCIAEREMQKYGYDLSIKADICQLLIGIIRLWQSEGFSIDNKLYLNDESCNIESVTEYIDKNITSNLRVSDVAKNCGLSYSCFAKQFRFLYGISCKEYIESMRIFKVEEFLLFTDFDLSYISQETGFSDCSHMIKSFRKHRNCTPKQFRLSKQGKLPHSNKKTG